METLNKLEIIPAKQGFIRARMNKDNLCNVLFWVLIVASAGTAFPLKIFFIAALYFVVKLNPVTLENDLYTSKSGRSFKQDSFCKGQYLLFVAIAIFVLIIFPSMTGFAGGILLTPTLYCILKNIPITVYFKKEAWSIQGIDNSKTSDEPLSYEPTLSLRNLLFNPRNSWYTGNIYHHKRTDNTSHRKHKHK